MSPEDKRRVLFVCTGNACRSPMAEAILRRLEPERYSSASAGVRPAGFVHRYTLDVLAEIDADTKGQQSKGLGEFLPFTKSTVVVTLSSYAARKCPDTFGAAKHLHWPVFDPIRAEGNEELRLSVFRGVRDEIRRRIEFALAEREFDGQDERSRRPRRRSRLLAWLRG